MSFRKEGDWKMSSGFGFGSRRVHRLNQDPAKGVHAFRDEKHNCCYGSDLEQYSRPNSRQHSQELVQRVEAKGYYIYYFSTLVW